MGEAELVENCKLFQAWPRLSSAPAAALLPAPRHLQLVARESLLVCRFPPPPQEDDRLSICRVLDAVVPLAGALSQSAGIALVLVAFLQGPV